MEKQDTKELHDRRFGMDGRVAVVTGSSHGIGLACAQRLASAGCEVVLVSRTARALTEAEQSLASKGLRVRSAACDVCDFASGEQLDAVGHDCALDNCGGVAILARQNLLQGLEQPYFGAETPKRLREFASDRPRADHREPPR